jgi:EAL domain-containing protein (putative c-di-GMP-specific phosphodiesterase class I)/GGDEF domain-containing protein
MADERPSSPRALLVSESPEHARMLEGALAALDGWDWVRVGKRAEAAALLRLKPFAAVLADTDDGGWDAEAAAFLRAEAGASPLLLLGRKSRSPVSGVWIDWDHFSYAKLAAALATLAGGEGVRPAWDPATGLPAARLFLEQVDRACEQALKEREGVAALVLRFEGAGPAGIPQGWFRAAAACVRPCLRPNDVLGRSADGELGVLLPGASNHETVESLARRMLEALRTPALSGPEAPRPSIGAAFLSQAGPTGLALLEAARRGATRSTALGGDCVHFDETRSDDSIARRFRSEVELRLGLALGQFTLHWIAQASLDGKLLRAEAGVRWLHPDRGLLPPAEFMSLCEAYGLAEPLFDWALKEALRASKGFAARRPGLRVTVKLAPAQFKDPGLVDRVLEALHQAGCPGGCLGLSVSDAAGLAEVEGAPSALGRLRDAGIELALDDFGRLGVPVGWMKRLPLDVIKLDQGLVEELDRLREDERIAEWVVSLAHQMGLSVVAEGVGRVTQLDVLRRIGCDQYQGDLLARPQTFKAFEHGLHDLK